MSEEHPCAVDFGRHHDVAMRGLCTNLYLYNAQGRKPDRKEVWEAVDAFLKEKLLPGSPPAYQFASVLYKEIIFSIEKILLAYDRALYEEGDAKQKLKVAERKLTARPEEFMQAMQEFVAAAQGKQQGHQSLHGRE